MRRDLRILEDGASLSVLADHAVIPPFGVAGGRSGAANRFVVIRDGNEIEPSPVPGKVGGFKLQKGDIVRMESSGGGGYGDPLKRKPENVARDVSLGYLNATDAQTRYGVILDSDGVVDDDATMEARQTLVSSRLTIPLSVASSDTFDGSRRCIELASSILERLNANEGDLVEVASPTCASALRGWARIATAQNGRDDVLHLGPLGAAVLGAKTRDQVELRLARLSS